MREQPDNELFTGQVENKSLTPLAIWAIIGILTLGELGGGILLDIFWIGMLAARR